MGGVVTMRWGAVAVAAVFVVLVGLAALVSRLRSAEHVDAASPPLSARRGVADPTASPHHVDVDAVQQHKFQKMPTDRCNDGLVPIVSERMCGEAALRLGLDDTVPSVIESSLLPGGCYYKKAHAVYYNNWLNHSAAELHKIDRRLFLNIADSPAAANGTEQSPRSALCQVVGNCVPDINGLNCDDWLHSRPQLGYSCERLGAYGLQCTGCRCNGHPLPRKCGSDPRLHCRHEKALRKHFSQYGALLNQAAGSEQLPRAARIVAIGDTHGRHTELSPIPPGDVLVHTGDFTSGTTQDPVAVRREISRFNAWIGKQSHRYKFFVAGNHDVDGGVTFSELSQLVTNAVQLLDSRESVDLDGDGQGELIFYGAPWQPQFEGFSTYVPEGDIAAKWAKIPADTDVVITHSPPYGAHDFNESGQRVGCRALRARLDTVEPLVSAFGHIHAGRPTAPRGSEMRALHTKKGTLFANVAAMPGSGDNQPPRPATVIDINLQDR